MYSLIHLAPWTFFSHSHMNRSEGAPLRRALELVRQPKPARMRRRKDRMPASRYGYTGTLRPYNSRGAAAGLRAKCTKAPLLLRPRPRRKDHRLCSAPPSWCTPRRLCSAPPSLARSGSCPAPVLVLISREPAEAEGGRSAALAPEAAHGAQPRRRADRNLLICRGALGVKSRLCELCS